MSNPQMIYKVQLVLPPICTQPLVVRHFIHNWNNTTEIMISNIGDVLRMHKN